MEIYHRGFTIARKDDRSPLTEADLASHRHIIAGLQALDTGLPILSEESATIAFADRRRWSRYWLIDPLDGTRDFIKRNGEFTLPGMVKLVVQKRKARMGRNPATGEAIKIPAKTVVKARVVKQMKDAVLPRK